MDVILYILLALVVAVPLYGIILYNRLVAARNLVEEGWSGIDVQLRRRANLVPNLIETVKGYAAYEKGVLEELTAARAAATRAGSVAEAGQATSALSAALRHVFALAEAYPELQADDNFRQLQSQLAEIEDAIQKARRYYNGAVRRLNTLIEVFPSNIVARQFGFQRAEYFEIEDEGERAVPKVDFEQ